MINSFCKRHLIYAGLAVVISLAALTSCRHPSGPSTAVITVVDTLNKPVAGASVELTSKNQKPPGVVYDKQVTGGDGKSHHSFEREAILDIIVKKDTLRADDIIMLEPHEKVTRTVVLK